MTKSINITCTAYAALFVAASLCALCLKGAWPGISPVLGALAIAAIQVSGFLLTRRHSLLSFSFSFLPALTMLAFFLSGAKAWLFVTCALFAALGALYTIRPSMLPKSRFTTQKWLSGLILAEVMLALIIILIRR